MPLVDAAPPMTPLIVTSRTVAEWRGPLPTNAWAWDGTTTVRSIQEYFRADKARGQGVFGGDAASQGRSVDVAARFCKLVEVLKPAVASGLPERVDYGTQCGALCRSADPALPAHQERLLHTQHNARAVWNELVHRVKKTQRHH